MTQVYMSAIEFAKGQYRGAEDHWSQTHEKLWVEMPDEDGDFVITSLVMVQEGNFGDIPELVLMASLPNLNEYDLDIWEACGASLYKIPADKCRNILIDVHTITRGNWARAQAR